MRGQEYNFILLHCGGIQFGLHLGFVGFCELKWKPATRPNTVKGDAFLPYKSSLFDPPCGWIFLVIPTYREYQVEMRSRKICEVVLWSIFQMHKRNAQLACDQQSDTPQTFICAFSQETLCHIRRRPGLVQASRDGNMVAGRTQSHFTAKPMSADWWVQGRKGRDHQGPPRASRGWRLDHLLGPGHTYTLWGVLDGGVGASQKLPLPYW